MERKLLRIENNKEKKVESPGIFFRDENLTYAGQIIQNAIKEKLNEKIR